MANNKESCLKIALVAEQRLTYLQLGYTSEECAALTHDGEVKAVAAALEGLGHQVTLVPGISSLVEHLVAGRHKDWDLVFNMAQGFHGSSRESQVPALLEAYMVPYTFSSAATMALLPATRTRVCPSRAERRGLKQGDQIILDHYGVPNARFMVVRSGHVDLLDNATLPPNYPLFVKPVIEGSSKGIDGFNKVNSLAELERAVKKLQARFPGQDILVESFLSGREFTVSILGTGSHGRVIGVREHIWQASPGNEYHETPEFASWESKLSEECVLRYNDSHDMDDAHVKAACRVALDTWAALGCRDAGRVDIRFDTNDADAVPNVLEVNPIAGLLPGHSPLPASASENGLSFEALLTAIIASALSRDLPGGRPLEVPNGDCVRGG
ncbi:D-alanine--D-alanine ligase [Metarhizium album ARSEF 1941]|uniref:D-alanine--D-alanine ligase n=1 Tax=Metarhizium album (strain ARSEF 1941) TaxID=1081103 RepID=A0A0B2WU14_METAS|nr:D-alanine--D-alanine ligase [Metarhizium album ARSEF 1941]KHN96410.1 D-alanine--D-alanine ligase [Metarhizium album ARSEF 1941]